MEENTKEKLKLIIMALKNIDVMNDILHKMLLAGIKINEIHISSIDCYRESLENKCKVCSKDINKYSDPAYQLYHDESKYFCSKECVIKYLKAIKKYSNNDKKSKCRCCEDHLLDEYYVVYPTEDSSDNVFCSEDCVVGYYTRYIHSYHEYLEYYKKQY